MTLRIFASGFWLQARIALFFFITGLLIGWLAMSAGVSPEAVNSSSMKLQQSSGSLKNLAEKTFTGKNEHSWVFYLFGNGLANTLFISMFFFAATFKSNHEVKGYPGIFPAMMFKFTGWYLRLINQTLNSSYSFLQLAMVLTMPNVISFGLFAFSFGIFSVSAVKLIGLLLYLAAIVPHGIFEVPAALASGAMPLAMLIEIIRQKRENEDADTWEISRQLAFSRSTGILLAVIFSATVIASIIEGHYTNMICETFFPSLK